MALPLMPSTELFQPKPEPESAARSTASAGYIVGCQCAMCVGVQPEAYSDTYGAENGRIRGRYTVDCTANGSLAGLERWLDPATGDLYVPSEGVGRRVSAGMVKHSDGTWRAGSMIWEAT